MSFLDSGMSAEEFTTLFLISILVLAGIGLLIYCFYSDFCSCDQQTEDNNVYNDPAHNLVSNSLIPPLFFTQGIKDPLQQDDLIEDVKKSKLFN